MARTTKSTTVPGTLSTLPSGRVRAQFVDRSTGRPVRVGQTFDDEDLARAWLVDQAAQRRRGTWIDHRQGQQTVGELGAVWLAGRDPRRKAGTLADERSVWGHLVKPRWETVPLGDVRHSAVQAWLAELARTGKLGHDDEGNEVREPLSASRSKKALAMLDSILDLAIRDRLIPGPNPCEGLRAERHTPQAEPVIITVGQVEDLLTAIRENADEEDTARRGWNEQIMVVVMGYGALRWGEAVALEADDIEVDGQRVTLHVTKNLSEVGGMHEQAPKSYRSRDVVLPRHASQIVLGCMRLLGREGSERLIQTENGSPFRRHWVTRRWRDLIAKASLPTDFTPHDLRASHATHCVSAGMPVLDVAKRLGHSHSAVLVAHYARASWDGTKVAEAVDTLVTEALTARAREKDPEQAEAMGALVRSWTADAIAMDYVRDGGKGTAVTSPIDVEGMFDADGRPVLTHPLVANIAALLIDRDRVKV